MAALAAVRAAGAAHVVIAVPVGAPAAVAAVSNLADVLALAQPQGFTSVSQWYDDFEPIADSDVAAALDRASKRMERVAAARAEGRPWQKLTGLRTETGTAAENSRGVGTQQVAAEALRGPVDTRGGGAEEASKEFEFPGFPMSPRAHSTTSVFGSFLSATASAPSPRTVATSWHLGGGLSAARRRLPIAERSVQPDSALASWLAAGKCDPPLERAAASGVGRGGEENGGVLGEEPAFKTQGGPDAAVSHSSDAGSR